MLSFVGVSIIAIFAEASVVYAVPSKDEAEFTVTEPTPPILFDKSFDTTDYNYHDEFPETKHADYQDQQDRVAGSTYNGEKTIFLYFQN